MVNISQKDFNLDMHSYLSKRRKPKLSKSKKKKKPVVTKEFNEELKDYARKKSIMQKLLDFIVGEELTESEDTGKKDTKEPSKGIFEKIKSWFSANEEGDEEITEEEIQVINEDVKEVLKIQNKWLLRLPKNTIKEFKESSDYKVYKETLTKYNLIKNP